MRWVRPDLTTPFHSSAFASSDSARMASLGSRSWRSAASAAMWIEDGKTSLEDCEALTWSFGWTSSSSLEARVESTSLVFMLELVPEPVWKTSIGNWSSCSPAITASVALTMAFLRASSSTPSSLLAIAAARLIWARAWMCGGVRVLPEIGKFSTAL